MPTLQRFRRYAAYSSILLMHLTVAWSFPSDAEAGGKTAKQITACDRLAEHPEDQNRRFEGVAWSDLSPAIAVPACQQAIEAQPNLPKLQFQLGRALERDRQFDKAILWYRKAAESGYGPSQINLGYLYDGGEGVEKDHAEAVRWYRAAAAQGIFRAFDALGESYRLGRGVDQDHTQAVDWYRQAADRGYALSQTHLGLMYELGLGVEKDLKRAEEWYRRAVDQEYAAAQFRLGRLYRERLIVGQERQGYALYKDAARQGYVQAIREVFMLSPSAGVAVLKDHLSDIVNPTDIDDMYRDIPQVRLRDILTFYSLKLRAGSLEEPEKGDVAAQYQLGSLLFEGARDIERDSALGLSWLVAAANRGHIGALLDLAAYYDEGTSIPQNYEIAAAWLDMAARRGNRVAQRRLGQYFAEGKGRRQDNVSAYFWLALSTSQGDEVARKLRDDISQSLSATLLKKAQDCASSDPPNYDCGMSWLERVSAR